MTEIRPVVAPAGTVVVIRVSEFTLNVVDVTLNLTEVAPVKSEPVTLTSVPGGPLVGVKLLITGAAPIAIVAVPTVSSRAHTTVALAFDGSLHLPSR